jgi:hypothetical protein
MTRWLAPPFSKTFDMEILSGRTSGSGPSIKGARIAEIGVANLDRMD